MKSKLQSLKSVFLLLKQVCPSLFFHAIIKALCETLNEYLPLLSTTILLNAFLAKQSLKEMLMIVFVLCILLFFNQLLLAIFTKKLNVDVKTVDLQLEQEISKKAMQLDYECLEDKETLNLIEKAKAGFQQNGGVTQVFNCMSQLLRMIFVIAFSIYLLTMLLFQISPVSQSGILAVIDTPMFGFILLGVLVLYMLFGKQITKHFEKACLTFFELNAQNNREYEYYNNEIALNYAMGKDIRLFQMQDALMEELDGRQKRSYRNFLNFNKKIRKLFTSLTLFGESMNGIFYLFIVAKFMGKAITAGDFITYAGTITKLSDTLSEFTVMFADLMMICEYMLYYQEFLQMEDPHYGNIKVAKDASIRFEHVSYTYPGTDKPALDDISVTLEPGKRIAVVGLNGAGKTTFVKLLCGLYHPQSGKIFIDDKEITQYASLQDNFSVVFQDFTLFPASLAENIAVSSAINETDIKDVLQRSGFQKRLVSLPQGIHTSLSIQEHGIELSGGEAQKVAIARALYQKRDWVILDEPTAALDPLAEIEIYTHFNTLIEDRNTLYISHRMSSCQFCDEIIVFEGGNIIQKGTHKQLRNETGRYQELWDAQASYYDINPLPQEEGMIK